MINEFYKTGHYMFDLEPHKTDCVREWVSNEQFVPDDKAEINPDVATWESGNPTENLNVPINYRDFFKEIADTHPALEFYRQRYGAFSHINVMLQRYSAGCAMSWHSDAYDPCPIVLLCYVTDGYKESDGGILELGIGDVDDNYMSASDVMPIASVLPISGRCVFLMNNNPRYLHRVTAYTGLQYRYAFVVQFGYTENAFAAYMRRSVERW